MTFACLAALVLAGCARVRITPTEPGESVPGLPKPFSITPPLARIPLEEELEYEVSWWGIPVGTALLSTSAPEDMQRHHLILLRFEARTNWSFQTFYPVRVKLTSWFDPETRSPRRFESYLKRLWRTHESVITFDPAEGVALHELPEGRRERVPIQPTTQDGLSMLYTARMLPLELGKTIPLEVAAAGKNWALKGEVVRAHVVRIGRSGDWPAVEGQIELAYPVPFFHGARARVWFSADEDRIPLLAKIRSRIGPVTVVLTRRSLDPPRR